MNRIEAQQLRILIVPGNDWLFGPKQYLNDIVEIMAEKHDVFVWHFDLFGNRKHFLRPHKTGKVKLIRPWSIHSGSLLLYYFANFIPHSIQFVRTVRKLGIDVVIALNLMPTLWTFSLAPSTTLKVFGFQDYFPQSATVYYKNLPKIFRSIIESASLVVNKLSVKLANLTLSPCFSLVNLSKEMGCKRNFFLPNGVDTAFFTPPKPDEKLKEKLGLSNHTLVFYGLIENWLDCQTVLEGLKIVKKEFPDAKLLIIGSTLTGYTKVLEKMLQDTGLANDVVLTGYVQDELVPHYLNLGTISLMPYKINTFSGKIRLPIKLFIYSAMGKPILSAPLPEVKRQNPKHVYYYYDETSFARNAAIIFNNKKLQKELAHHAREFAENFDYSKLAQRCEAVLLEACTQNRGCALGGGD